MTIITETTNQLPNTLLIHEHLGTYMVFIFFPLLFILVSCLVFSYKKRKNRKNSKSPYNTKLNTTDYDLEKALNFLRNDSQTQNVHFRLGDPYCDNKMLDGFESSFFFRANQYAQNHNLVLLVKVRISDVIYVPGTEKYSETNRRLERAIEKRHFDFVLCKNVVSTSYINHNELITYENLIPFLVIEIDGTSHESEDRIKRDELVDMLISRTNQCGNDISILHIIRGNCYDANAPWKINRYVTDKFEPVSNEMLSVEELLDKYTGIK